MPSSFVERVYPVCNVYTGISGRSDVSIDESRLCSKVDKIIQDHPSGTPRWAYEVCLGAPALEWRGDYVMLWEVQI